MLPRIDQIEAPLVRLDQLLGSIPAISTTNPVLERWRSDAAALRFHLKPRDAGKPLLIAIIGGTGTGKSTIVNRLLGVDASATSFRRTFTAGPVAIVRDAGDIPHGWLGVDSAVATADKLPARGQNGALIIVPRLSLGSDLPHEKLLKHAVLIDTPDLDGDQPVHHTEADRAFRWAQGLIFLVTPEKYQMTELLPYYRLAARYATPALFVMNKCEEQAVAEDYRQQLERAGEDDTATRGQGDKVRGETSSPAGERADSARTVGSGDELSSAEQRATSAPRLFIVPRDDAAYDAPAGENLAALRDAIPRLAAQFPANTPAAKAGVARRAADLIGRFEDQILAPLRQDRREADRLIVALHDMETPAPGVDVNPVTQDLERRLQQRSVLYLMGPQRVLDRVRQAPMMLLRLPRTAWDYMMRGEISRGKLSGDTAGNREVPDFKAVLADQFSVLQSRIDDLFRTSPAAQKWVAVGGKTYEQTRLASEQAAKIADEEMAELRNWLEKRWNATPRDTRVVQSLLKYLPGGKKLTAMAESAPYLLTLGLIAHHALFGTDLIVLGGYTLATWLSERISNEVAARTRAANVRIAERFTKLAHEQIQKMANWIDQQAAPARTIGQLEKAAEELAKAAGMDGTGNS